jgi:hypothetical protein
MKSTARNHSGITPLQDLFRATNDTTSATDEHKSVASIGVRTPRGGLQVTCARFNFENRADELPGCLIFIVNARQHNARRAQPKKGNTAITYAATEDKKNLYINIRHPRA